MKLHADAALSLKKRLSLSRRVVEQGWSLGSAAVAAEVSERTAGKWVARYRAEGERGCWVARRRRRWSPAISSTLPATRSAVLATLRAAQRRGGTRLLISAPSRAHRGYRHNARGRRKAGLRG